MRQDSIDRLHTADIQDGRLNGSLFLREMDKENPESESRLLSAS